MSQAGTRLEHDLLGELAVPADAYYGVQTARALTNFHISGVQLRLYPDLIKAFAMVKMAAARANFACGQFSREILTGIEKACQELIDGKLHDQFRLDVFQGGAGTSTNMNANEVIANRALELMGHAKGEYQLPRSARPREWFAVHERRLPERVARRHGAGQPASDCGYQRVGRGIQGQGRRVRGHREDGPHAAARCRSHDAGAGVRLVWRDAGRRSPAHCSRCGMCSARSTWAGPPSAPASTRPKATQKRVPATGLDQRTADLPRA